MGYSTTPITLDQARKLVNDSEGEVVSASHEKYFDGIELFQEAEKAEIKDDGLTIFFRLPDNGFIEYCLVRQEDMTSGV